MRRRGRAGCALTLLFTVLALALGFAGVAAGLDVTQPAVAGARVQVRFEVRPGDTTAAVAARLQQAGLIRNAIVFRLLARARHLDTHIEAGIYDLSPAMSMDALVARLVQGHPDQRIVTIPEGLRLTQYPHELAALPHVDAQAFLRIAKTGVLPDGTNLSSMYWYVEPPRPQVAYALEGYLFPDTYAFDPTADATVVVRRLLDGLGEHLCPGPDAAHLDAYIHDPAQCKAHGARIGSPATNIFTLLEQRYFTTDDTRALHDALTLASLTIREIAHPADAPGVTDVFYNRYLVALGKIPANPDHQAFLGSDPAAEYARDTDHPPARGQWWAELGDTGANVDAQSPYNADAPAHTGLIPGPIAAPGWTEITAAADANANGATPNFFFVSDHCGTIHYASQLSQFTAIANRAVTNQECWA